MILCADFWQYSQNSLKHPKIKEWRITIDPAATEEQIKEFILDWPEDLELILHLHDDREDFSEEFCAEITKFPQVKISAARTSFPEQYANLRVFSTLDVGTFKELKQFIESGMCEVYINDYLFYDLELTRKICQEKGVKIRFGFSSMLFDVRQAFVFPQEDIDIDVLDFADAKENFSYLYSIFSKNKVNKTLLFTDLYHLALKEDSPADPFSLTQLGLEMNYHKTKCQGRCWEGVPCQICDHLISKAQILYDKKIEQRERIDVDAFGEKEQV